MAADGPGPRGERSARIRAQERAEVATHVHDSVLHTLALIQRHADDPREVTRLARGQERELRRWLYRPAPTPTTRIESRARAAVAAEVEDAHGVTVEVVVVGDCPLDEALARALRRGARGTGQRGEARRGRAVSLYAEVEHDAVSVFVRDRGRASTPTACRGPARSATVGHRPDAAPRRHGDGPRPRRGWHGGAAGDAEERRQ